MLLQVYADFEGNPLLRQGIEFCCRQFYILHRKPFILQMFASVAPLLEFTVGLFSLAFPNANNTPILGDFCVSVV